MTCLRFVSLASLLLTLAACADETAPAPIPPPTDRLVASYRLVADGAGTTTLYAGFSERGVPPPSTATLEESDVVVVRVQDQVHRSEGPRGLSFFGMNPGQGTEFSIALERSSLVSAKESSCTMTAPLSVELPPAEAPIKRAEALVVKWDAPLGDPSGTVRIRVSGDCIDTFSQEVSDTGLFEIPPNRLTKDLFTSAFTGGPAKCDVTLSLERARKGSLDKAFSGGTIECVQSRLRTLHAS